MWIEVGEAHLSLWISFLYWSELIVEKSNNFILNFHCEERSLLLPSRMCQMEFAFFLFDATHSKNRVFLTLAIHWTLLLSLHYSSWNCRILFLRAISSIRVVLLRTSKNPGSSSLIRAAISRSIFTSSLFCSFFLFFHLIFW